MKKDKQWAIKEAKETINGFFDRSSRGVAQHYEDELIASIADIINQLDEPKVLSQEWIDEHEIHYNHWVGAVPVTDLQNLLVPTLSEMEKVQLSQKTADELNRYKELGYSLKDLLVIAGSKQAQETFARAWLDGYEVEKEQKYLVNILDEGIGAYLIYYPKSGNYGVTGILDDSKGITRFTEQEIKDYDERFWPFAVKAEELEE